MSIPTVTLDFCSEPVNLHCPVCGQAIFTSGIQQSCCRHVIFLGDSASASWSWLQHDYRQEFNRRIQKKHEEISNNGFHGSLEDYIATMNVTTVAATAADSISRKSAFIISLSTSDIGCGGMYNGTIYAIFDYLPAGQRLLSIT